MGHRRTIVRCLIVLLIGFAVVAPAHADKSDQGDTSYRTGFVRWRAAEGGFNTWSLNGTAIDLDGTLCVDRLTAQPGTDPYPAGGYNGHNFYNGGSFYVGEATSPEITTSSGFTEAIASWNAATPTGTWAEMLIRAKVGDRWTKWYNLGVWAADNSTIERHSVNLQGDADGYVSTDTLVLTDKKIPATAFQLKLRLFSAGGTATPIMRNASVAYSTTVDKAAAASAGNPALWNRLLAVPECSQMVYPDGGNVWCSPTSTSMVVGYWEKDTGPCAPRVHAAVEGVYDWLFDGHGNWPFNTAYAASRGLEGYVVRFTGLDQAEPWIAQGVPVIISFGWKKSSLTGAAVSSSGGHLSVIVGFDTQGNPIVNDPAAASDAEVQRTYNRAELEAVWQESSGGTVYLIYPQGWPVPALQ